MFSAAKGAKTIGIALAEGVALGAPLLVGPFTEVAPAQILTTAFFQDQVEIDAFVLKWKALDPDIFTRKCIWVHAL